jgi:hypothetical protein
VRLRLRTQTLGDPSDPPQDGAADHFGPLLRLGVRQVSDVLQQTAVGNTHIVVVRHLGGYDRYCPIEITADLTDGPGHERDPERLGRPAHGREIPPGGLDDATDQFASELSLDPPFRFLGVGGRAADGVGRAV